MASALTKGTILGRGMPITPSLNTQSTSAGQTAFNGGATTLVDIASLASSSNFKIVAEPWDGNGGYAIAGFPAGWASWNGNYRDSVRMYMTGNVTGYVSGASVAAVTSSGSGRR